MDGYSKVFEKSTNEFKKITEEKYINLFSSFRSQHAIYGFIDNGDNPPDQEAIQIAKKINEPLYNIYCNHLLSRKIVGYDNSSKNFADYSNVDSRHIMMSILLFNEIKTPIQSIIEIGGGFGNWLFLNNKIQKFKKWFIVDLPHLGLLQSWYLDQQKVPRDIYEIIESTKFDLDDYPNNAYDIVIGTHSLSEFSLEIFYNYFQKIVIFGKYFFYSYHNTMPSPSLISAKLKIIDYHFTLKTKTLSEAGNVSHCFYEHK